jgi:hypothetical protein
MNSLTEGSSSMPQLRCKVGAAPPGSEAMAENAPPLFSERKKKGGAAAFQTRPRRSLLVRAYRRARAEERCPPPCAAAARASAEPALPPRVATARGRTRRGQRARGVWLETRGTPGPVGCAPRPPRMCHAAEDAQTAEKKKNQGVARKPPQISPVRIRWACEARLATACSLACGRPRCREGAEA